MVKGSKIAIIGFGKEGVSAANFLGLDNEITIIDEKSKEDIDKKFFDQLKIKNCNFYFSQTPQDTSFDLVVRSPGVRPDNKIIEGLIKNGAVLTSPTKIFFDICPCPIIAVTGTKGKGTTSTLIYEMLKTQHEDVFLAGNIGTPALEILPKLNEKSLVVLEMSSFQLMDLTKSPHIAIVLMVTQEHLDWHQDKDEYIVAKTPIVKYQTNSDFAVINADFPSSADFAKETKANVRFFSTQGKADGYLEDDQIICRGEPIAKISDVLLPGRHNLQNVLAAVMVAKLQSITSQNIKKVLSTFAGLPHRLQLIRELAGVKYYNDSFSTTPETTIAAVESFPNNPKIIILGGSSKNSDFSGLAKAIIEDKTVKAIILIGKEATRIKEAIGGAGIFKGEIQEGARNMEEIVKKAKGIAKSGDIVILSPACASFDMFKNYEDRGQQFISEVNKIK